MGRKRGKNKPIEADSGSDRLVELLAQVLEGSGVWNRKEEDTWGMLASSLDGLAKHLEKFDATRTGAAEVPYDDLLLQIEEAAQAVRSSGEALSVEIQKVPQELLLCQELESICQQSKEFSRLRPLCRSLTGAIRRQRCMAEDLLQNIKRMLSNLHSMEGHPKSRETDLVADIRRVSISIRRRCLSAKSSPWKDAIEFLRGLGAEPQQAQLNFGYPTSVASNHGEDARIRSLSIRTPMEEGAKVDSSTLLSASSIVAVAEAFARTETSIAPRNFSLLLVGAEGSGKTHCCDQIESMAQPHLNVIRPSLPFDAIGLTVGSAEDLVISMVAFAKTSSKRSILMLDDVENICGNEYAGPTQAVSELNGARASGGEPHLISRVRIVLLTLLETIRREWKEGNEMLVICTSKINFGKAVDRFDRIFTLSPPNAKERREVLLSHVGLFQQLDTKPSAKDPDIQALLSNTVDCTAGLSYAELTQYCRQALLINRERASDSPQLDGADAIGFFEALKQQLQSSMPESLRSGVNSDFVDMKVISARDLRDMQGNSTPERPIDLPLYGSSAKAAWEELRRLIVVPICQAKALDKLMFQHGGSGGKVFAGGVLLTGPPGCGKSALAYHCAAIASALNPSVKLIDVSCTSLIHKEVGSSERSIHRLFKSARSAAPCIMLMDGIENVAAVRGNDNTTEGTMDRVLSTLLTELDGVDSQQFSQDNPACLAIIGITHNANWVDPALRRPGRLERVIELGRPEREARRKLVEDDLKGTAFKSEDDNYPTLESLADHVAQETEGFTGAAVVAVCNEAKMLSSKEWIQDTSGESPYLSPRHVFAAIELQRAGQR